MSVNLFTLFAARFPQDRFRVFLERPDGTVLTYADLLDRSGRLANTLVEGTAGGGLVKATVTGDGELRRISIDPSVVDPNDVETLEDLVRAATTDALTKSKQLAADKLGGLTGGLKLPGL